LNDGAFDAAMAMFSRVWGFPRPCRPTLPREHVPNPATVTLLGQSVPDRLEDRVDPHAKLNKQGDACLDLNRGRYRCWTSVQRCCRRLCSFWRYRALRHMDTRRGSAKKKSGR